MARGAPGGMVEAMDVNGWLYAGGRPNRVARALNRVWAAVWAAGLWPGRMNTLEVRGRRTGRRIALPVVIAEHDGERHLVAMLGPNAGWVANVRAAHGDAVLCHGRREAVWLEELPPAQRAPVLRRYLEVAPAARAHFPLAPDAPLEAFERIAAEHPVFRVRPAAARRPDAYAPAAAPPTSAAERTART